MSSLGLLFTPITIGTMEVKNRVAMAPMATDYAESDGRISQRLIDYLEARAAGRCRAHHVRDDDDRRVLTLRSENRGAMG